MIRRRPKKAEFTQVQNAMLLNPNLSLKAKGLLTIMMSRPEDWTFYMSWLEAQSTDGRDAHRSAMQELIGAGYVERNKINGEAGKIEWEYIVDDVPFATIDGFSGDGSTVYGKPAATNTDYTNTNSKDASASRAASQPQEFAGETGPEERMPILPSGPVRWTDGGSDYENDEAKILAAAAQQASDFIIREMGQADSPEVQAIWDKYLWWTVNGCAALMDELANYAKIKGVDLSEMADEPLSSGQDFADETPPDFTSGPSAHPEPQTPPAGPPESSTGHSLLDRLAQLKVAGADVQTELKQRKHNKEKDNRRQWAIRGSINNAAEQAIFDAVGESGFRFMLRLIKDIRTSPDAILGWLKRKPYLIEQIARLTEETYVVHVQAGIDKAKLHPSGWQSSPLPWFFEALVADVPKEQRKAEPNGNSRHEYNTRISAAMSPEEVEDIIMEFHERGQLETRRKRDEFGRMLTEDGKPVHNSVEEEIAAVLDERGFSSTKGSE